MSPEFTHKFVVHPISTFRKCIKRGCSGSQMENEKSDMNIFISRLFPYFPQHFLYFFPLPQGQGSFLPILGVARVTCLWVAVFPSKKNH